MKKTNAEWQKECQQLAKRIEELKDEVKKGETRYEKMRIDFYGEALTAVHNAIACTAIRHATGLIGPREAMLRTEGALRAFWNTRQRYWPIEDEEKYMPNSPEKGTITMTCRVADTAYAVAEKDSG